MIIFNLQALVVGGIIALFYWLISLMVSDAWLATGDNEMFLICIVGTVVSTITEFVGLKGRLFWLPMWLFGLVGTGIFSFERWGWYGPIGMVVIAAGLFGAMMWMGKKGEEKEWENAPGSLEELQRQFAIGTDSKEFWEALKNAFFEPSFMKYTPEVCQHNLVVVEVLSQATILDAESEAAVEKYKTLAESGLEPRDKPVTIPNEIEESINKVIDAKIEFFEETNETAQTKTEEAF